MTALEHTTMMQVCAHHCIDVDLLQCIKRRAIAKNGLLTGPIAKNSYRLSAWDKEKTGFRVGRSPEVLKPNGRLGSQRSSVQWENTLIPI